MRTTAVYISDCWEGEKPVCTIHICSAHLMHAVSTHLHGVEKKLKRFLMLCTARIVESKSMAYLDQVFSLMCEVVMSRSQPNETSLSELEDIIKGSDIDEDESVEEAKCDDKYDSNLERSWVGNTPYYKHFHAIVTRNDTQQNDNSAVTNIYHAPDFIKYLLRRLLAKAPLCTGLEIEGLHQTNSTAENWFRNVKQTILQKKKRLRPGQFIRVMAHSLHGRLREYMLPSPSGMLFFSQACQIDKTRYCNDDKILHIFNHNYVP